MLDGNVSGLKPGLGSKRRGLSPGAVTAELCYHHDITATSLSGRSLLSWGSEGPSPGVNVLTCKIVLKHLQAVSSSAVSLKQPFLLLLFFVKGTFNLANALKCFVLIILEKMVTVHCLAMLLK